MENVSVATLFVRVVVVPGMSTPFSRHLKFSGGVPLAVADFWQFNLYAGWRFWQRRAELQLGLLNVGDQDYQLNPVNLTYAQPRGREFMARFKFNF